MHTCGATAGGTRLNVLHVVSDRRRRGAQVFAAELAGALDGLGVPSRVLALHDATTAGALDVEALGPAALSRPTLEALRRAMAGSDVVVAHGSRTLPACAIAGLGLATPFVYRSIGDLAYWTDTPLRRRRVRLLLRRATVVVALWDGAAETISGRFGVDARRVAVIPNAARQEAFPPVTERRRQQARRWLGLDRGPVVASVGSLSPEKDVRNAIEAVGRTSATLLVVGEGPERAALEAAADRLVPGRVRVMGPLPSPVPAYHAADLLLLTSRSEGQPGVLIEAGLAGVGAVATDVGGVRAVVVPGTTGVLVEPGDPAAIARAIQDALPEARRLGHSARERCLREFEMKPVARSWAALLAGVVGVEPVGQGTHSRVGRGEIPTP